jgi:hypothetical protein
MTDALRRRLFPAATPAEQVVDEHGRPADFAERNLAARWVG